jgi:hypothetical protein
MDEYESVSNLKTANAHTTLYLSPNDDARFVCQPDLNLAMLSPPKAPI